MLATFIGCLAALVTDRVIVSAVQVWGMKRMFMALARHHEQKARRHWWHPQDGESRKDVN